MQEKQSDWCNSGKIPKDVNFIIDILRQAGYEAYAVGGCVRDLLLERPPKDWDITTSARPGEVKKLFRSTVDTGIIHGTVTVILNRKGYEVTTYRIDGEYRDGRHPDNVEFTGNLLEDLKRRDFTINAFALSDRGLVDEFDGLEDLKKGIIRCVGNPYERFGEDALRMLRAVRFASELGFRIEEKTAEAIKKLHGNLKLISAERINAEFTKILVSPNPSGIRLCYELGITSVIMPQFDDCMVCGQNNPNHLYTVGEHTIKVLEASEPDRVLRLAAFFHDFGKPMLKTTDNKGMDHFKGHPAKSMEVAREIMKNLKYDNNTIDQVSLLVCYHDERYEAGKKSVRRVLNKIGADLFEKLYLLQRADVTGQSDFNRRQKDEALNMAYKAYLEIISEKDCFSLPDLKVNGQDLLELGVPKGPEIGKCLNYLLEKVMEEPQLNSRKTLIGLLMEYRA